MVAIVAAAAAFTAAIPSFAGETVVGATPTGGNDLGGGLLPPPGLYGAVAYAPAIGENWYDAYGHKSQSTVRMLSNTVAGALEYVYPFEVFGGHVASMFQASWSHARVRYEPGFGDQHDSGLADPYVDVFNWSRNVGGPHYKLTDEDTSNSPFNFYPLGFNVSLGFAAKLPIGNYTDKKAINVGSNLWILSPNIGMTYLSPPDPLGGPFEVSGRAYYSFPLENDVTHYQTGQVVDVDWAVAQYLNPALEVGLAGVYQQQVTSDSNRMIYVAGLGLVTHDSIGDPSVNGTRYADMSLGPVISYTLPNNYGTIKFKYLAPMVHQESSMRSQIAILSYAVKLY
jgi:hypothetical protein